MVVVYHCFSFKLESTDTGTPEYHFHGTNKTGVFVKHESPRRQQSPKLAIFSIKVMVKVTMSLTFVSFIRISLVEMNPCQI